MGVRKKAEWGRWRGLGRNRRMGQEGENEESSGKDLRKKTHLDIPCKDSKG